MPLWGESAIQSQCDIMENKYHLNFTVGLIVFYWPIGLAENFLLEPGTRASHAEISKYMLEMSRPDLLYDRTVTRHDRLKLLNSIQSHSSGKLISDV